MTGDASAPAPLQPHIRAPGRLEKLALHFKDPENPFQLVIVRDMWLTGFDAPSLHTMYIDKPMRGHSLMQAIARALDAAATASTPEVAARSVAPDDKKPAAFLRGFQGIRISFDVNAHGEQGQGGNLERVAAAWTEQCAVVAFSCVRTCDRCDGANQRAPPARK